MTTLAEAQKLVDEYILTHGGYWDLLSNVLRLNEEMGELSRELNNTYGAKKKKDSEPDKAMQDEFGDLFFMVLTLANKLNIDLTAALEHTIHKYETRDKGRWTGEVV